MADGSGTEELLLESGAWKFPTDWSADGRYVAYNQIDLKGKTKSDLWILPLFGDRKPFAFLQTESNELWSRFSPDGRWIAYCSDESEREEVYVAPFQGPGAKLQISTTGGRNPVWRRDGQALFYMAGDDRLMMAEVRQKGPTLEMGVGHPLFPTYPARFRGTHDVSPGGERILVNTAAAGSSAPLTLVINWTADMHR